MLSIRDRIGKSGPGMQDDHNIISRTEPRIALAELFKGKTQDEWRAAYAGAYDWGPDLGREIVPE